MICIMKLLTPKWPTCVINEKDIEGCVCVSNRYMSYSYHSGGENEQLFCWDTIGYSIPTCSNGVAHLYPSATHFHFLGSSTGSIQVHVPESFGALLQCVLASTLKVLYIITILTNISVSTIQPIHQVLLHGKATKADFLNEYDEFLPSVVDPRCSLPLWPHIWTWSRHHTKRKKYSLPNISASTILPL